MSTISAAGSASAGDLAASITSSWYWYVIAGIVLLIGGFMGIARPMLASLTVEVMTAIFFIVGGILQAIQLFRANRSSSFIWSLLLGVLFIILGIALLKNPLAGLVSLTIVAGSLIGASGIVKIIYAFQLRPLAGWVWMLISGMISLLLAIMIFTNIAVSAAITLGILLSVELISSGIWMLLIGFGFRKVNKELSTR
ncbi:HdeD family acid-resistance protein [Thiofilum flexile]|uniref:HdeD family acid-resistance protein n=1 Tax=Thiofilum flexile TaxID=125627 RepID=UPI0003700C51|nr:DUF308 domain-containing protein [Thiofilum flexile]